MNKNQGFVGHFATDGKAFMARIGAVSLPQSAWILQHERWYPCFPARCVSILQGRLSVSERPLQRGYGA
ncbi:hypothetical protein [Olivibacter sp. XZL3]|uniref:hypothetical protein n=1 Tax=Olivibacter sp. XZL3 TaxID=1735116 RepID=UPI001416F46F|nr:hypothetical protein [Olivibacter sp. XZL3]